eukprot:2677014-Ditylum_brightwellii.AAC.1
MMNAPSQILRSWTPNLNIGSSSLHGALSTQAAQGGERRKGPNLKGVGAIAGSVKANIRNNHQRLSRLVNSVGNNNTTPNINAIAATAAQGGYNAGDLPPPGGQDGISIQIHPNSTANNNNTRITKSLISSNQQQSQQQQHQHRSNSSSPPHLDFSRNHAFAASLRSERESRMQSWAKTISISSDDTSNEKNQQLIDLICKTRGSTEKEVMIHRELHHLSRVFYSSTSLLAVRNAVAKNSSSSTKTTAEESEDGSTTAADEEGRQKSKTTTIITGEMISSR